MEFFSRRNRRNITTRILSRTPAPLPPARLGIAPYARARACALHCSAGRYACTARYKFATLTGKLRLIVSKATFSAKLKNSKASQCCFFCVVAKRFFALLFYLMFTAQQKKEKLLRLAVPLKLPLHHCSLRGPYPRSAWRLSCGAKAMKKVDLKPRFF